MARIPASYKAFVYESFGTIEEILKFKDVATEPLAPSFVRVQVRSAAVNPIDFKIPEIYKVANVLPSAENPKRIGLDVAGVVVEVGSAAADQFQVGDEVYAMAGRGEFGSLAEYFSVGAQYLTRKPKTLDFDHAAGVPLASLTSYQAVLNHAQLKAGEKILILGGSSATGTFAVQHAKALGAHVIATTSAKNVAFVKALGADEVIDYTSQKWGQVIAAHSLDVVFDCAVEPQSWEDDAQTVLKKETGRFVTLKRGLKPSAAKFGATYREVLTDQNAKDLSAITTLIEDGKVKVFIDSVFPLEKTAEAFTRLKTGRAVGKVVVHVA